GHDHADDVILADEADALDAAGVAAHGAGVGLVEANGHAAPRTQEHLVAGLDLGDADERVLVIEVDADQAALADVAVLLQARLLDQAAPRGHEQMEVALEGAHGND